MTKTKDDMTRHLKRYICIILFVSGENQYWFNNSDDLNLTKPIHQILQKEVFKNCYFSKLLIHQILQ